MSSQTQMKQNKSRRSRKNANPSLISITINSTNIITIDSIIININSILFSFLSISQGGLL